MIVLLSFIFHNFLFLNVQVGLYKAQQKIISNRIFSEIKGYEKLETAYAYIYYTEKDQNYVNMIKQSIDFYYPLLRNDYGIVDSERIDVILYASSAELSSVLPSKKDIYPMGAYYGGIIHILSPRVWAGGYEDFSIKEKFMAEGPIVHELSHLLLDKKTKGMYELWFTEGLALYYENKYIGFTWREDLKEVAQEISLEALTKDFHKLDEALAYRRAFDIVADFVQKNGEKKLQSLIGAKP